MKYFEETEIWLTCLFTVMVVIFFGIKPPNPGNPRNSTKIKISFISSFTETALFPIRKKGGKWEERKNFIAVPILY